MGQQSSQLGGGNMEGPGADLDHVEDFGQSGNGPDDQNTSHLNANPDSSLPGGRNGNTQTEGGTASSRRSAKSKGGKRKQKQKQGKEAMSDKEHSKEEESARTLLELKGAFGNEEDAPPAPSHGTRGEKQRQSLAGQSDAVAAAGDETEEPVGKKPKKRAKRGKAQDQSTQDNAPRSMEEQDRAMLGAPVAIMTSSQSMPQHQSLTREVPEDHLAEQQQPRSQQAYVDYDQSQQHYAMAPPSGQGFADMPVYDESSIHNGSHAQYGANNQYDFSSYAPVPETPEAPPETGQRKKRKRNRRSSGTKDSSAAALADAASAANALIDPALTNQDGGGTWDVDDVDHTHDDLFEEPPNESFPVNAAPGFALTLPPQGGTPSWSEKGQQSAEKPSRKRGRKSRGKSNASQIADGGAGSPDQDGETTPGQKLPKEVENFSREEINRLTQFMEDYRSENGLSEHQLNEKVQMSARNKNTVGNFWDLVSEILPNRERASILKVCRRRFHNFPKRGKWTPEEDIQLQTLEAEHPRRWKHIGEILDRMPEDCRDRWRNYVKCGENRNKDVWTEPELWALKNAVAECKEAMRKTKAETGKGNITRRGSFADDEDEDDLLSWGIISEKMAGTRSRLQCMYKWKKIKAEEAKRAGTWEGGDRAGSGGGSQSGDAAKKPTWRTKRAEANAGKMLTGDLYHLVHALRESGTYEEGNIVWRAIGSPAYRKNWTSSDRRVAFRNMKEKVPDHEAKSLQEILDYLLHDMEHNHLSSLHEFYEHPQTPAKTPKQKRKTPKKPAQLSADVVGSDEEEQEVYDHSVLDDVSVIDPALSGQGQQLTGPYQMPANNLGVPQGDVDQEMAQQVHLLQHA
ncbi:MAG: hypothetical protein M4579_003123 [Chaenotheca gracillima]|nr:MAG: hypothetical protein M4579_003123 [Chaenotheca gracillima]